MRDGSGGEGEQIEVVGSLRLVGSTKYVWTGIVGSEMGP